MTDKFTYKDAGVDVELADRVIGSLANRIRATHRNDVIGRPGGFAALVRPDWSRYEDPVLVSATDGVGTKLKLAFLTGVHDTVGVDLVAMNVNDVLVNGAEPLFFLDYLATGAIDPQIVRAIVSGIADGCEEAGCSLIGGETAEMPDFYAPGEYDLAGFCVGIVDRAEIIDGRTVEPGDAVIGLASTGLHSNGFSLVRKVLLERRGYTVDSPIPELGRPLGEELLTPTAIYVKPTLDLIRRIPVSGMAHITGGGFQGNIPRILPESVRVTIRRESWTPPPIFDILRRETGLDEDEMFRTFNMGVGFICIVRPDHADAAVRLLADRGVGSAIVGEVSKRGQGDNAVAFD